MKYDLIAPCHFGMESVLKREIFDLGYDITAVTDGRITFAGDAAAIAEANIFLRTAGRIMICIGQFTAMSFEELFEGVKALPFEEYLPKDAAFPVTKVSAINSQLMSERDIQSITKKAIVERLKQKYKTEWFKEDGNTYPIRVFLKDNHVEVCLDTTGVSLHKRGYKKRISKAPISETLAAGLILLTPFKQGRMLFDPFCGTGTIPIEAAMIAGNIAPGLNREFNASKWENIVKPGVWEQTRQEAKDLIVPIESEIFAYDIDNKMIGDAKANAASATVEGKIHFKDCDVSKALRDFYKYREEYGFIVTNPPYGERLNNEDLLPMYEALGEMFKELHTWSMYVITSYEDAQKAIGNKANKNRKIYNGMKKTYYYQYQGPKPPK